jgi:hypothetical protein
MRLLACLGALPLLMYSMFAAPAQGQIAPAAKNVSIQRVYDPSKEITLEGTVETLVTKATPGTLGGAHLVLATAQGKLDTHLGAFALTEENAAAIKPGQRVKVVGAMTTLHGNRVKAIYFGPATANVR